MVNNLFYQYFSEGVDISKFENLVDIAVASGLDKNEVSRMLKSNSFVREVMDKDSFAKLRLRVSGVPSFTINYQSKRKPFTFSGAQVFNSIFYNIIIIILKIKYVNDNYC